MPNLLKGFLTAILLVAFINACSTSKTTMGGGSSAESMFPSWYNPGEFESDSTAYYGCGEAISNDSTIAAANAELQARANFESHIAELLEEVRMDLVDQGYSEVTESDFIITLRNAHQKVQDEANRVNAAAVSIDKYYRGFAQVRLTNEELKTLIRSGFSGKTSYVEILNSAEFLGK